MLYRPKWRIGCARADMTLFTCATWNSARQTTKRSSKSRQYVAHYSFCGHRFLDTIGIKGPIQTVYNSVSPRSGGQPTRSRSSWRICRPSNNRWTKAASWSSKRPGFEYVCCPLASDTSRKRRLLPVRGCYTENEEGRSLTTVSERPLDLDLRRLRFSPRAAMWPPVGK